VAVLHVVGFDPQILQDVDDRPAPQSLDHAIVELGGDSTVPCQTSVDRTDVPAQDDTSSQIDPTLTILFLLDPPLGPTTVPLSLGTLAVFPARGPTAVPVVTGPVLKVILDLLVRDRSRLENVELLLPLAEPQEDVVVLGAELLTLTLVIDHLLASMRRGLVLEPDVRVGPEHLAPDLHDESIRHPGSDLLFVQGLDLALGLDRDPLVPAGAMTTVPGILHPTGTLTGRGLVEQVGLHQGLDALALVVEAVILLVVGVVLVIVVVGVERVAVLEVVIERGGIFLLVLVLIEVGVLPLVVGVVGAVAVGVDVGVGVGVILDLAEAHAHVALHALGGQEGQIVDLGVIAAPEAIGAVAVLQHVALGLTEASHLHQGCLPHLVVPVAGADEDLAPVLVLVGLVVAVVAVVVGLMVGHHLVADFLDPFDERAPEHGPQARHAIDQAVATPEVLSGDAIQVEAGLAGSRDVSGTGVAAELRHVLLLGKCQVGSFLMIGL